MITSRYDFSAGCRADFHGQELDSLKGADLRKKCDRLPAFGANSKMPKEIRQSALTLADGNPRLLEWFSRLLEERTTDSKKILSQLAEHPIELREQVLAEVLTSQISTQLANALSRWKIFEISVPQGVLHSLAEEIDGVENLLKKAKALGLLEVSPDKTLRVPKIVSLDEPDDIDALSKKAAQKLHQKWHKNLGFGTEDQCLEIIRLALIGKEEEIAFEVTSSVASQWYEQNRFQEGVELCQKTLELGENPGVLYILGCCEGILGKLDLALSHHQKALNLCPQESSSERGRIIYQLGIIHFIKGQIDKAKHYFNQSDFLHTEVNDLFGQATSLLGKATLQFEQGRLNEAEDIYKKLLSFHKKENNISDKAVILKCIAQIHFDKGYINSALKLYDEALKIFQKINYPRMQCIVYIEVAAIHRDQGRFEKALALIQEARKIAERLGDVRSIASALHGIGRIKAQQGKSNEAMSYYEKALYLSKAIGDLKNQATATHEIGRMYNDQNKTDLALPYLTNAINIANQVGDIQGKAASLHELATIHFKEERLLEACKLYENSIELERTPHGEALSRFMLAKVQFTLNELNKSDSNFRIAINILKGLQSPISNEIELEYLFIRKLLENKSNTKYH